MSEAVTNSVAAWVRVRVSKSVTADASKAAFGNTAGLKFANSGNFGYFGSSSEFCSSRNLVIWKVVEMKV